MVWSMDTDDFHGDCSKNPSTNDKRFNDNFPLMRTINEAIVNALQDIENEIPDEKINKTSSSNFFHGNLFIIHTLLVILYAF